MAEIPHALVKDLLSTGYFFEGLKNYSKSAEIDLSSYNRDFTIPYLEKTSKYYEKSGQFGRSEILNRAARYLSHIEDSELACSILELRKTATSEVDSNEKALFEDDFADKSERLSCRQKSESAQWLVKMLVSIIRVFKLAEVSVKRDKHKANGDGVADSEAGDEGQAAALQGA